MDQQTIQTIIIAVLSSGLVAGIFNLLTKKSKSPESQNDLARIGNEFASKLLEDARLERKELKDTITQLETLKVTQTSEIAKRDETITKLQDLLSAKDEKIAELEMRQREVAHKLTNGLKITLADIFGHDAPHDIHIVVNNESVA